MLYELAQTELKRTQFIIVDKEHQAPRAGFTRSFTEWQMAPNDPRFPALISYYKGH